MYQSKTMHHFYTVEHSQGRSNRKHWLSRKTLFHIKLGGIFEADHVKTRFWAYDRAYPQRGCNAVEGIFNKQRLQLCEVRFDLPATEYPLTLAKVDPLCDCIRPSLDDKPERSSSDHPFLFLTAEWEVEHPHFHSKPA